MRVRSKLHLNAGIMALLMFVIGTGGLLSALVFQKGLSRIRTDVSPALHALTEMQSRVWALVSAEEDPGPVFQELETTLALYQQKADRPEADEQARIIRGGLLELRETLDPADPSGELPRIFALSQRMGDAVQVETRHLESLLDGHGRRLRRMSWVNALLMLGGVLVPLFSLLVLARRIGDSLREAHAAALAVSGGDLRHRLEDQGADDIGELSQAFNHMLDTLGEADAEITREVEERIRAEQKAQAAARAKSDFLAHMSHEFRTPLNGILGYTQVLMLDRGLSEKNRTVVQSLRRSGESLLELINDVLDLAKIEAQRMNIQQTRFYLQDFVDALRESYSEQARLKGLDFRLTLVPGLPEDLLADPIRLRQVLVNLLGNAIKFTDAGHVEMRVERHGNNLRFSVVDTGIGIAAEDVALVMQPFMQVDHKNRKNQGTGLGLSISHRLLEMMGGGGLKVDSEPGKGTTFWFDLPQPGGEHRRLVMAADKISGYRGERRRILLAEDARDTTALLAPLLRKTGFEVFETLKNMDVATCVREFKPHAVILDMFVEGGGVGLMRLLQEAFEHENLPLPPVIMLSDNADGKNQEMAKAAGAAEFLAKPIRFGTLLKVLESRLGIEWEFRSAEAGPPSLETIACPPHDILQALLELALAGNVRQLREQAESLPRAHPRYRSFSDQLLSLCATYQINAIQDLLRRHLNSQLETQA